MYQHNHVPIQCLSRAQLEPLTTESSLTISMDKAFHLLQNSRRRAVLRYLLDGTDEGYSLRAVADQVAAWETEIPVSELSGEARKRVYVSLYQIHCPKLDAAGVIDYDQPRGTLAPRPLIELFALYIEETIHPDPVLMLTGAAGE